MKRPWIWASAVLGVVLVAGAAVVFASRFGTDPTLASSPLVGKPAPEISVTSIDDSTPITLADFEGSVIVVNFWAPWCIPCREEHAVLLEAATSYASAGVTGFLDELGRGYAVAMDDRSRAAIAFGVRGVPETFFIDRAGIVVGKVSGAVDWAVVSSTLDAILVGESLQP